MGRGSHVNGSRTTPTVDDEFFVLKLNRWPPVDAHTYNRQNYTTIEKPYCLGYSFAPRRNAEMGNAKCSPAQNTTAICLALYYVRCIQLLFLITRQSKLQKKVSSR